MKHAKDGQFWVDNPQRAMANNSVAYTEKPDSAIFMEEWLNLMRSGSGERGIFNVQAAREKADKFARMDGDVRSNPCCFSGDMKLLTADGYKTFAELCGTSFDIVTITGEASTGKVWSAGIQKTIKVILDGRKTPIVCTPDHIFSTEEQPQCEAKDLVGKHLNTRWDEKTIEVLGIEEGEELEVYDFEEPLHHWGLVEGVIAHNCEALLMDRQLCNLTEVVVKHDDTVESLLAKVEAATLLGCLQATLTYFPNVSEEWKKNAEAERLLGVSLTGVCDSTLFKKVNEKTAKLLREMQGFAHKCSKEFADELGMVHPKQVSLVKPSGTVSQLCNSASGLHPRYSDYYIRRVRVNAKDPIAALLAKKKVPHNPEVGETWEHYNTLVFDFPMKSPRGSLKRDDFTAIEQLEYWKMFNLNWSDGNPSVTIYVKEDEWVEVGAWVYKNWEHICGLSFLNYDGGHYQLAPYEEISAEEYHKAVKEFAKLFIDFDKDLLEFEQDDKTEGAQTLACTGTSCEL